MAYPTVEGTGPCWFVGAFKGNKDYTDEFVEEGIWKSIAGGKNAHLVDSIRKGERIAIKAAFTRKKHLPFDNRGYVVSVMAIKAIGTVTREVDEQGQIGVDWIKFDEPREWYFYTYMPLIWRVERSKKPGDWCATALIDFTFNGATQDIDRFRNDPFWMKRFGDPGVRPKPQPPLTGFLYSIDDIVNEGCFLPRETLEMMLERLRLKKNLILQGPPGTGKTWLSKRLAYALMGEKSEERLRAVQFHPNLCYEDFICGLRPDGEDGKLKLVNGPFIKMIDLARSRPDELFVIVIEEINRGNPAQIFGEMLTLLEADKRNEESALELSYKYEKAFIPPNLYVIGTMNIADRSLALVDLALRRRFAFVNLEPALNGSWRSWVEKNFGFESGILRLIEDKMNELNKTIASDASLGKQFQVGHSYVTPGDVIDEPREWFKQVVETEIAPLLEEYWFDDASKADKAKKDLLEGI